MGSFRAARRVLLLGALGVGVGACAEPPSSFCGEGTRLEQGACVADEWTCGPGTWRNPDTSQCEVEPSTCPQGTALIQHRCQDPTAALVVDLEEGPEPNGIGPDLRAYLGEFTYQGSAGAIELPSPGSDGVVVHGCIVPHGDTGDVDVYDISVPAPTLIQVTVDGVGGLFAGFCITTARRSVFDPQWQRCATWFDGDTAKRQLLLPAPGNYKLWLVDSRAPAGQLAAGDPNGGSCYYATVDQLPLPVPTPLDTSGATAVLDHNVHFYEVPGGSSLNKLRAFRYPGLYKDVLPNAVVLGTTRMREFDWTVTGTNQELGYFLFGGRASTVVAIDEVLSNAREYVGYRAPSYELILTQYASTALSRDGGTVSGIVRGTEFYRPVPGANNWEPDYGALNLFHYEVENAGEFVGLNIHVSTPVQGDLHYEDDASYWATTFTGVGGPGVDVKTFTDYRGIIRHEAPGRYYFWLFAPRSTVGDPITVTSTYRALVPTRLSGDASTGNVALDPIFGANLFLYDRAGENWQEINASGSDMGEIATTLFPATTTAWGRLNGLTSATVQDAETTDDGAFYPDTIDPFRFPLQRFRFVEDGSGAKQCVLGALDGPVVVQVAATAPGANPTFALSLTTSPATRDFGTMASGARVRATGERLSAGQSQRRYFFALAPGSLVTIRATSTGALDPVIALVARDGSEGVVFDAATTGTEVAKVRQDFSGYTAFVVRSATAGDGDFDLELEVAAPYYRVGPGTTPFVDVCGDGERIALVAGVDEFGQLLRPDDEGVTGTPIATPSGFEYFGQPVSQLMVAANGYVAFGSNIRSIGSPVECSMVGAMLVCERRTIPDYIPPPQVSLALSGTMPDGVGAVHIAPYWTNWYEVNVCKKTIGRRLVIQWTGQRQDDGWSHERGNAHMQLVLDADDQSIEFVYGPYHFVRAGTGGVSGLQDVAGFDGTESFDPSLYPFPFGSVPGAGTSVRFVHP